MTANRDYSRRVSRFQLANDNSTYFRLKLDEKQTTIVLGGIAVTYVGQPLDTVKVKMQTFPSMYKGMIDCFVSTLKTDGITRGLYAGTVPAVVANVAENSVLFVAYGGCQKAIANALGNL